MHESNETVHLKSEPAQSFDRVSSLGKAIGDAVEAFVRNTIVPLERETERDHHGCPTAAFANHLRDIARSQGLITPHILGDGSHLTQVDTANILIRAGLSPLGPLALHVVAPDEGNMFLLGKVASAEIKQRFLDPLVKGRSTSAFFMTEPAADGGAG